jgi:hypothetical protein
MNHTPAPWSAHRLTYNWSIESTRGHPVARVPLDDTKPADVALMAAAPELLAALLEIEKWAKEIDDEDSRVPINVRQAVWRAIAQATTPQE